ncbi:MAG: UdgX family uracil-DNA binding protein [Pseudomonadota bacterium]
MSTATHSANAEHIVTLESDDDPRAWKREVRRLLREGIAPEQVVWRIGGEGDLFGHAGSQPQRGEASEKISLPRASVTLVDTAIHHSDAQRFALLYRFLWRSQTRRHLVDELSDPDTVAVRKLAKAIRRDAHKMHAFVRFRKVGERDGREQYAAWFEPDHHIVEREAAFFVRRFSNMDWAIVTPRKTAIYEDGKTRFAPGGKREDVPAEDAFEDAWRAYYAHIFNPARIMTDAMRAEMPKKYWKNLPEASLIPSLLESAPARVAKMNKAAKAAPQRLSIEADDQGDEDAHETADIRDWESFEAALHQSTVQDSGEGVGRLILGEGPKDARIMLVGEQPGDQEDQTGRLFIGPAGQLLDQRLQQARIDRQAAYITNAVKRFRFTQRGKVRLHKTPKAHEFNLYTPFLIAERKLIKPKVTVALGATALRALIGSKATLARLRGETLDLPEELGGGILLPTFHPSYLLRLRDPGQRAVEERKFAADLAKAAELATLAA